MCKNSKASSLRLASLFLMLLTVLGACKGPSAEGRLEVSSEYPLGSIEQGRDFDIILTMRNVSSSNAHVKEIRLPADFMQNVEYKGSNPGLALTQNAKNEGIIKLDMTIAPGGEETILFRFNSMANGLIRGLGLVNTDVGGYQFEMQASLSGANPTGWQPQESPALLPDAEPLGSIPYQAVVQIKALVEVDGEKKVAWTGSGTLISRDGLILTNAHVVLSDRFYQVKDLVVALTLSQDSPPVDTYHASIVQADARLDLAVIKVRSDMQDRPLDYASLNLPAVPLGDSDSLKLGDNITILGYPGIGGETITLTRGEVSGFTAEEPYGNRAYIKTTATIAGGNSGGLAVDSEGKLIGIPTKLGSGNEANDLVDCRPLFDTNRDGYIDEKDSCVPTGGFINALRPVRLSMELVQAAQAGQVAIQPDSVTPQAFEETGKLVFADDFSNPNSGWTDAAGNAGSAHYEQGGYLFKVEKANYWIWDSVNYAYDNVVINVDSRVLKSVGDGDYGIMCGENGQDFYGLEISEDGYFSIWQTIDGETVFLVDWTYSEVVATGTSHAMSAVCGSNGLTLAVDGVTLATVQAEDFKPGPVGLVAGTYDNAGLQVLFDNFEILLP